MANWVNQGIYTAWSLQNSWSVGFVTCFSFLFWIWVFVVVRLFLPHRCTSSTCVEGMCLLVFKSQDHRWPLLVLESTVLHPEIWTSCWLYLWILSLGESMRMFICTIKMCINVCLARRDTTEVTASCAHYPFHPPPLLIERLRTKCEWSGRGCISQPSLKVRESMWLRSGQWSVSRYNKCNF